jgi:7-cyano-7-deazaguanine synthase
MNAVVLASGGLDSTVTAAVAKRDGHAVYFLTIAYGQRHAVEVERAREIGRVLDVRGHLVLDVDLRRVGGSALTADQAVPKDRAQGTRDAEIPVTYVPARNTIFLALALAYAETLQAGLIFIGANIVDYSGYPDCRPEYLRAFEAMARLGTRAGATGHAIRIEAPLVSMSKADIIRLGGTLAVPFHLTHSCYDPRSDGRACGRCDSCRIRREGFQASGVRDPTVYAEG